MRERSYQRALLLSDHRKDKDSGELIYRVEGRSVTPVPLHGNLESF